MNRKLPTLAVAIVVSMFAMSAQVQAAPQVARSNVLQSNGGNIAPPGPEADPYLQHYKGTPSFLYARYYWEPLALDGHHADEVMVAPPGPEADLYLQRYQGTASSLYGDIPVKLGASTWRLADYERVTFDGAVTHPYGEDAIGLLLITPERYASIEIAPADQAKANGSFIGYTGKLSFQGDKSIHPFINHDPAAVGVDQVTSWEIRADKLILTTPATDGAYGRMVWELVK
jgi:hypothetical protein